MTPRIGVLPVFALGLTFLVNGARADVVNFDEFLSPPVTCCYADTGVVGPLVYPHVSITDSANQGFVMNSLGWDNMQTSGDNLFGTLNGPMILTFNVAVSNLKLDVINGTSAADFTVSVFDEFDGFLLSQTQSLNAFAEAGSVGTFVLGDTGIRRAQVDGNGNFAIDTISFDTSEVGVPEPASFILLASALACIGLMRFRRKTQ